MTNPWDDIQCVTCWLAYKWHHKSTLRCPRVGTGFTEWHSSTFEWRADPCTGRTMHPSRDLALQHPINGPLVYECPWCRNWHGTKRDRHGLAAAQQKALEDAQQDILEPKVVKISDEWKHRRIGSARQEEIAAAAQSLSVWPTRYTPSMITTLDAYQLEAAQTAIYDDPSRVITPEMVNLLYVALGLAGEAGEVANKVKKLIRDGDTPELRVAIEKELGGTLWYLAMTAKELGTQLSQIATTNLNKLADRKERGVLTGSGDDR